VPAGAPEDRTEAITAELERFAPGFRDTVLGATATSARELEVMNPNLVGGDLASGAASAWQLLARPVPRREPWRTPLPGVYLCGASTAPGPGVHGQSGWQAARLALRELHVAIPDALLSA
jgi:phytoene dehydrogenase-like protein